MREKHFDGEVCEIWLEDGIVYFVSKVEEMDISVAKTITKERINLVGDKDYPILGDYLKVKNVTKEARDFMASKEGTKNIKAIAALINSPVGRIIGNFYIRISKPPFAFKIFTDKEKALEWLKQFI